MTNLRSFGQDRDCAGGRGLGKLAALKNLTTQPGELYRSALALLAGLLLAVAFPKINVAGLAWLAPGLMLAAAAGLPGKGAFRIGYLGGLAHFLATLYYLWNIPMNKIAPITGWLLLSGFLALYPATWVWLCWRCFPVRLKGAENWRDLLGRFLETTWLQRTLWALLCAALWVAGEMVRARLFSGFPLNFLGASQYRMLPLIQIAAFGGIYAVSFLVAWFSAAALCGAAMVLGRPEQSRRWMGEIFLPLLIAVVVASGGARSVLSTKAAPTTLKAALIQPSIPQTMIWDPAEGPKRFKELLALSEAALTNKPALLVWPEAAVPSLLRWDTNQYDGMTMFESVQRLARSHGVWIVLGADDLEPNAAAPGGALFYNSSLLISPSGELTGAYRKQRLVMFGEYVPLARWLPFLRQFTGIGSDFTPGTGPAPFRLGAGGAKTAVLICFEDIFPHFVRASLEDDTDFLLNLTNNGWFGESAAQWQHAATAVFRAVENGLPLVRCANNGLTCLVDAQGRMQEVFFPGTQDIYGVGFKLVEVPLRTEAAGAKTLYRRHGDWFGWSCVLVAGLVAGLAWRREGKANQAQR